MSKEDFECWLEDQIQKLDLELDEYEYFDAMQDRDYVMKQIERMTFQACLTRLNK